MPGPDELGTAALLAAANAGLDLDDGVCPPRDDEAFLRCLTFPILPAVLFVMNAGYCARAAKIFSIGCCPPKI